MVAAIKVSEVVPPRHAKRRKLASVVLITVLVTFLGLKARSAEIANYEESLRKAEDAVKMGKSLEEEGGKLQEEERATIGRQELELDVNLERKEAVLEERVRKTERLLQEEEKELDNELPAIEREAVQEKVKKIKDERQEVEQERQRLSLEEVEIRQSERRIDEEVRRLRRDRALRVFNVLPAFQVLLGQTVNR
mmetsp:Transcript_102689/g.143121  ORF Transcript_102689/g.143121 Transcript_102689/m.143121 type:complete len:194 (+) Transcript_102689:65-646(+)